MKRLAIIGAGEFQLPLIKKAKELGYETHVFAWLEGAIGKEYADYFYALSITEKEKIFAQCKEIHPDGVVSIGSDLAVLTVNYVARKLHLLTNPELTDLISTNKFEMRKAFSEHHISIPKFIEASEEVKENQLKTFTYPLIVKPTDRSGSRGVTKVTSFKDLKPAIDRATSYSFEKKVIIEEFIDGQEYSCECISYNGKHYCLAFTEKYTSGAPRFIEKGHLEPAPIPPLLKESCRQTVFQALDALHIKYGASHCEFKIDENGKITVIEIGSRMGGDCIGSDLVYLSTGYDFLEMVIDVACGKEPNMVKKKNAEYAGIKFIFNQKDLNTLKIVEEKHPEMLYYVSALSKMDHEIVDSSTRFGFYIVASESHHLIKQILNDDV